MQAIPNTPYRYVLPIPSFLRGKLLAYNRLYAYPTLPEPPAEDGFVILDSGAFAMLQSGRAINERDMVLLAEHYRTHGQASNIFCAAPDVSKNPKKSMANLQFWIKEGFPKVNPVLQFESRGFEWYSIEKQMDFYANCLGEIPFLFFAKRGSTAAECINYQIAEKLQKIREKYGVRWVHIFAGGWNKADVAAFSVVDSLDSIDSIAYYNTSKNDTQNLRGWGIMKGSMEANAIANAHLVNELFYRYG